MMMSDNANCITINPLLNALLPNNFILDKFFKTSTGLNDDKAHAGKVPANKPVNNLKTKNQVINPAFIEASAGTISELNGA